ncbi:MAG TPA: pyridoxal phosphate-dependent aminotransferase [Bryobacteraceae bacterium]|nr:pyridoxal phosphate-dependent aminotransferase [Bryobacteraceae bacterium]
MFSSRLQWSARLNPIAELLARKRASGEPILDLTESNPTHAAIEYPVAEISRALADPRILRYDPNPFGSKEAREAVAGYYCGRVDPARILLTASTSEAYAYLFKLLADPGDEILVPRPSYPLFDYLARLECVRMTQYPLFYDHGWHLDTHALRRAATERTRAIVVVNPNNPTGSYLKAQEAAELTAIAREHGLAIISDEVFSDYWLDQDSQRVSTLVAAHEALTFSLSGLSKTAGLPQMKLAWIVVSGPEGAMRDAWGRLELIADTYLSVGAPVQAALPRLLGMRDSIAQQIRGRVADNLAFVRETMRATGARLLDVEGGWYATLHMTSIRTEEEWALGLLEHENVLAQPGYFYDFESEPFLVLSLLTEPAIFREGVLRIAAYACAARS